VVLGSIFLQLIGFLGLLGLLESIEFIEFLELVGFWEEKQMAEKPGTKT
jgi:hypothetical protein